MIRVIGSLFLNPANAGHMKTIFDKTVREEVIRRIQALGPDSQPQWGKMNVTQMARHCRLWEEMIHQNKPYKRVFIGRLFGRIALRSEMKGKPMRQNNPSIPDLLITGTDIDLEREKQQWIGWLEAYPSYTYPDYSFVHPFFGKLTREEIGYFSYKHADHHLRQFNV